MPVDPQAVTLAAIAALAGFAAFGDKLGNVLKIWKQFRAQPNNTASNYFRDLGDAFAKVHAELKESRVPRIDGNRLNTLLQSFETKTNPVRGEKITPELQSSLAAAAKGAKTLDAWILDNLQLSDAQRQQLLRSIERAAGQCMALSTLLKRD